MAFNDHDHDHDHDQTRPLPYYIVLLCHVPIPYCTTPYRTIPDLHHMRTHPSYAMPCYASNLHDEEAEDVLDEDNHHDAPARRNGGSHHPEMVQVCKAQALQALGSGHSGPRSLAGLTGQAGSRQVRGRGSARMRGLTGALGSRRGSRWGDRISEDTSTLGSQGRGGLPRGGARISSAPGVRALVSRTLI